MLMTWIFSLIFTSSIFHMFFLFSLYLWSFTISRRLFFCLRFSQQPLLSWRLYIQSLFLALPPVLSPTPTFTFRLWILLSNTYTARTAIQRRVCVCMCICVCVCVQLRRAAAGFLTTLCVAWCAVQQAVSRRERGRGERGREGDREWESEREKEDTQRKLSRTREARTTTAVSHFARLALGLRCDGTQTQDFRREKNGTLNESARPGGRTSLNRRTHRDGCSEEKTKEGKKNETSENRQLRARRRRDRERGKREKGTEIACDRESESENERERERK